MANNPSPDDRPDPNDSMPAVRARVPEHVARGEISTGVIVVTGGTEYVLDFVRNLPRPNAIVARVILPHLVMPQFIDALTTNIDLYRQRYGELPGAQPHVVPSQIASATESHIVHAGSPLPTPNAPPTGSSATEPPQGSRSDPAGANSADPNHRQHDASGPVHTDNNPGMNKRQNPQEIYDELKIRDEILSGAYANAIMIGHGPFEFSFDFITNFYPQSAVSCRVYLAAGHVGRLLDSLKQSWDQLRPRLGLPPQNPPPASNR
jgi:hypothetical protein